MSRGLWNKAIKFHLLLMIVLCALSAGAVDFVLRVQVGHGWVEILTSAVFGGIIGLLIHRYIKRGKRIPQEDSRAIPRPLECLAESGLMAVYCWDRQGKITYLNTAALQLSGRQADEIGILRVEDMIAPIEPATAEQHDSTFKTNTLAGHQAYLLRKDGSPLLVFTGATRRTVENEEYVAFAVDISSSSLQKPQPASAEQMEQEQTLKAIGRLAGGIAHILNNLLNVIVGYTVLADSKLSTAHPSHRDFERVLESSSAASTLVHQLLALGGKQRLNPELFDVNTMLTRMEADVQELLGDGIKLRIDLCPEAVWVKADMAQIEEAIMNVARNARDAMLAGGVLSFKTKTVDVGREETGRIAPGSYASIEISDTGAGMDKETLSHIFEPFFTTKHESPEAGLGLAMVFGILQQSLGHIQVESAPGGGSLFRILLPAAQRTREQQEIDAELAPGPRATILLVEDQQALRELLKEVLSSAGFGVLEAGDGRQAVEIAAGYEGTIDLMLTDWVMPGMDGGDAARRVRQQRPEIKVVYMSGYSEEVIQHGLRSPHEVFLEKPVRPDLLIRSIRDVLDNQPRISSDGKAHAA